MTRDPRVDPRPGDVLELGDILNLGVKIGKVEVIERDGDFVVWRYPSSRYYKHYYRWSVSPFAQAFGDATVITRAEDTKP